MKTYSIQLWHPRKSKTREITMFLDCWSYRVLEWKRKYFDTEVRATAHGVAAFAYRIKIYYRLQLVCISGSQAASASQCLASLSALFEANEFHAEQWTTKAATCMHDMLFSWYAAAWHDIQGSSYQASKPEQVYIFDLKYVIRGFIYIGALWLSIQI